MNKFKLHLITTAACISSTLLFVPASFISAETVISTNNTTNFVTTNTSKLFIDPINPSSFNQDILSNWSSLPLKEDVSENKVWNVNLKKLINNITINDSSIFVLDEHHNKIKTNLTLSNDGNSVKVTPINSYIPGHGYLLCVIGSYKGVCMPFTISSDYVKMDQSFNNKNITLKKGQTLQLTLPNQGADGGYSWELQNIDSSIIKNSGNIKIITSCHPQNLPSESNNTRLLFKAVNTGTTSLELQYNRPWQANSVKPINTFKLNINVQ